MKIETPIIRALRWVGDSKKQMKMFPNQVQKDMGDALQIIQFGGMPKMVKPFKGCGAGIFELVHPFDTNTYRTVIAVKIGERIYVLDAFKKKSKKGIETPKYIIERIKTRLKAAKELAKNDKGTKKRI